MAKAEVTRMISASPELVFSYISDPEKYLQWQSHLLSYEPDSEPRVGMRATSESKFLGRRIQVVGEVTQLDPPKASAFVRMYRKQMQANHEILRELAEAEAAAGTS